MTKFYYGIITVFLKQNNKTNCSEFFLFLFYKALFEITEVGTYSKILTSLIIRN